MAKVIAKVFGSDAPQEIEATTVGQLMGSLGLVGYSAKVNQVDATDSTELSEDDVVRFTKEVKGGKGLGYRVIKTFTVVNPTNLGPILPSGALCI